ncbi:hypothetical protein ABXV22_07095 [Vibrio rotiferianus]|uniref:hypothetical protein n=1 Tax=Vibrio rotiferianus TaxID=190895 RepID=UPI003393C2AC
MITEADEKLRKLIFNYYIDPTLLTNEEYKLVKMLLNGTILETKDDYKDTH